MENEKQGKLIIFSAPSGAGKTTLVRQLMMHFDHLRFSVSACTRPIRTGEKDGIDYHFLSVDDFKQKIKENAFIEWEEVYKDHFYGTLYSEVERIRRRGLHVVFDVDVVGGMNIKKIFGDEALAVFVKPPSVDALRNRLKERGTDSADKIELRIAKAEEELAYENRFDVVIVNDELSKAVEKTIEAVGNFLNKE